MLDEGRLDAAIRIAERDRTEELERIDATERTLLRVVEIGERVIEVGEVATGDESHPRPGS